MLNAFPLELTHTVKHYEQRRDRVFMVLAFGMTALTAIIGLLLFQVGPSPAHLAWGLYVVGVIAIFYQPRIGVYLVVFFTLLSDRILLFWYPFTKNFSSVESIFFLGNSIIFSPLESYIVLIMISWIIRGFMMRKLDFHAGPLMLPSVVFISFVTYGLAYGLVRGGNVNIALWEVRPIYYLVAMLILTSNLIQTRQHVNILLWTVALALFAEGVIGSMFVANNLGFRLSEVERIAEHSMSIHFNSFFVLVVAVWIYRETRLKRIVLPLMVPFVLLSYLANQRRASFIALGLAILIIFFVLYRENRLLFWKVVPIVSIAGIIYIAAFWNSSGTIGMPAQAVRSVLGQADSRDDASNTYRVLENINILFTVKRSPLLGIGFGQKFYIIAPMADISFFIWWEYITHNSIVWMWMKAGVFGFVAMLYLIGMSLMHGMRTIWRMPRGILSVAALVSTTYVFMHFVYAYVDMSWDNSSMVYIGIAMGLINCLEQIAARPVPVPERRWPWQPVPTPAAGLRPL